MQIKQKLSNQILSLSNGYINKGLPRGTTLLPASKELFQRPTCKPGAHKVLEILSQICLVRVVPLKWLNLLTGSSPSSSADRALQVCGPPRVLGFFVSVLYKVTKGNMTTSE